LSQTDLPRGVRVTTQPAVDFHPYIDGVRAEADALRRAGSSVALRENRIAHPRSIYRQSRTYSTTSHFELSLVTSEVRPRRDFRGEAARPS